MPRIDSSASSASPSPSAAGAARPPPLSPAFAAAAGEGASPTFSSAALPSLNALQVVRFHPVERESDLRDPPEALAFSPLFCHHFFKDNECISGYDELAIDIFFSPDTFDTFIRVRGVISPRARDPAAIHSNLLRDLFESVTFPGGLATSEKDFLESVRRNRAHFVAPGRVVAEKALGPSPAAAGEGGADDAGEEDVVKMQLRECSFDVEEDDPFLLLHRRVEWFLHWFIESASAIHTDSQWRVILPYIVREKRRAGSHADSQRAPDASVAETRQIQTEKKPGKKPEGQEPRDDDEVEKARKEGERLGLTQKAAEKCEEVSRRFAEQWRAGNGRAEGAQQASEEPQKTGDGGRKRPPEPAPETEPGAKKLKASQASLMSQARLFVGDVEKAREESGFSVLPVFAVYSHASAESQTKRERQEESRENSENGERRGAPHAQASSPRGAERKTGKSLGAAAEAGSDARGEPEAAKQELSPSAKGQKREQAGKERTEIPADARVTYHLAGIATTYTFYAVTGFRRRISQFMVFPHMQRQGVGMAVLEHVYCDAILDPYVIEFTVEDPASSFSQLRDVASLKLLIDLGALPRSLLYPPAAVSSAEEAPEEEEKRRMMCASQRLVMLTKETTKQATRMSEILQLGQQLPHPLPPPPVESEDLEHRRDWRLAAPQDAQAASASAVRDGEGEADNGEKGADAVARRSAAPSGPRKAAAHVGGGAAVSAGDGEGCKEVRLKVKRRLKRENIHWLVDIPFAQQKAELHQLWNQLYVKYYRTLSKLRKMFPLPPTTTEGSR
ncbi:histone lysine acetyltransferase HAT1 [Besnoitia besnoiti]|uniref:histone acetyltransferase n=1 Tax=Besnoitia besnoiti TaxID=94643 RepID=A0A2A9MQF2_BESBE|nr:histone lysine acetyltransferase HAT1 [Besnoitia besnoiti]PFH38766.1 histone lysine acetyltransferase HAT1 [Besnoitia besnoiti]